MPLYMDIHELGEVSAEDVAKAHLADLEAQEKYGVNYLKYWVNENCGKVFCLVQARQMPKRQTPATVKRTAWSPARLSKSSPSSQTDFLAMSKPMRREQPCCQVAEPMRAIPGSRASAPPPGSTAAPAALVWTSPRNPSASSGWISIILRATRPCASRWQEFAASAFGAPGPDRKLFRNSH